MASDRPMAASIAAEMFEIETWSDLVAAAPAPLAKATGLEVRDVGGAICVIAPGIPSKEFNRCVGLGVNRPATEDDVIDILRFYRANGVFDAWIQVMEGAVPDILPEWLAARGSKPSGAGWIVFDRDMQPPQQRPTDLHISEIGAEHAEAAAKAFRVGYGLPPSFDPWIAALPGRTGWRAYAAFDGGAIVATAFTRRSGRRAAMAGAATLPEARGRGAQGALLAMRLRDAAADGVTTVQSHTWLPANGGLPADGGRNPSLNNMRRSGFRELHKRANFLVGKD